jgi:hypothetical protein
MPNQKKTVRRRRRGAMRSGRRPSLRQQAEMHIKAHEQARKEGRLDTDLHMPVLAFAPGSAIREAARIWWSPFGEKIDKLTKDVRPGWVLETDKLDPVGAKFVQKVFRRWRKKGKQIRPLAKAKPRVKVRLTLDYPLSEPRSMIATIDRRYPGEVFGLCHDFYQKLYAEDAELGGKSMTSNSPDDPLPLNRRRGPLIWGHDLHDLVFEGVLYTPVRKNKDGVEGEFRFSIGS